MLLSPQVKRILLLDGIVYILEVFTDYEQVAPSSMIREGWGVQIASGGRQATNEDSTEETRFVDIVLNILAVMPEDLIKSKYLPQLSSWVAGLSPRLRHALQETEVKREAPWIELLRRRIQNYLHTGLRDPNRPATPGPGSSRVSQEASESEGRSICLLGLVLSDYLGDKGYREQVLWSAQIPLMTHSQPSVVCPRLRK